VKLVLRGLLVVALAAVVVQAGAAAPARMRLVTAPYSLLPWNAHVWLLGTGRCDVATDVHEGLCVSGSIERTVDGGRTYRVVLHTTRPIYDLQRIGSN
jgi:hypothetical protein